MCPVIGVISRSVGSDQRDLPPELLFPLFFVTQISVTRSHLFFLLPLCDATPFREPPPLPPPLRYRDNPDKSQTRRLTDQFSAFWPP